MESPVILNAHLIHKVRKIANRTIQSEKVSDSFSHAFILRLSGDTISCYREA